MISLEQQKLLKWLSRCHAVAGSGSYIINGYPEVQVHMLMSQLKGAAGEGVDWRKIYATLYDNWHTQRPLFPDPETMAALMEQNQ